MTCYTGICTHIVFNHAVLGFFVPYFDLDVIRLPTPPCFPLAHFRPEECSASYQIQCPSDQVIFDTRAILRSSATYHNDRVLLHIVACIAPLAKLIQTLVCMSLYLLQECML